MQVFPPAVPLLTILIGIGLNHIWPIDVEFPFPKIWRYSVGGVIIAGAIFCSGSGLLLSSPEWPKRKPMEAYASARGPGTFSNHAQSNVSSDDPDLHWGGYHSGKRVDSRHDAIWRVGASTIRHSSRRGLPGTQVRRSIWPTSSVSAVGLKHDLLRPSFAWRDTERLFNGRRVIHFSAFDYRGDLVDVPMFCVGSPSTRIMSASFPGQ